MNLKLFSVLCVALACTCLPAFAQTLDRNIMTTSGEVYATLQKGDTLYVSGSLIGMGYGTGSFVHFEKDSAKPDFLFPQLGRSPIEAVEPDGNGGYYLGGIFHNYNGTILQPDPYGNRVGVIHILSDYSLDPNFAPAYVYGGIKCLKKQNNRLYIGGNFLAINQVSRNCIAALDATTGAVDAWLPTAPDNAVTQVEASDSMVYILGDFRYIGNFYVPDGFAYLKATDGGYTRPFSGEGIDAFKISNNKLYIGGGLTEVGTSARGLAKVSSSTALADGSFPETDGFVGALQEDGAGGYYVGGYFNQIGELKRQNFAHVLADGTVDTSFVMNVNDDISCFTTDGVNLYFAGNFTSVNGVSRTHGAAINMRTRELTAWDPKANYYINTMVYSSNVIYFGGFFETVQGVARKYAAAVSTSNQLMPWNPNPDNQVFKMAAKKAGSSIFMSGSFTTVQGKAHPYLVKVNATSGAPAAWNPNPDSYVYTLALNGSKLYAGGDFNTINGITKQHLAEIDTASNYPTAFQADANSAVGAISIINGKLYVGGDFTQLNNIDIRYAARIDLSTKQIDTWNPKPNRGPLFAGNNTSIVIGGQFRLVNTVPRNHIAAIDIHTNQITPFNPDVASFNVTRVHSFYSSGNELFAGGDFNYQNSSLSGKYASLLALDTTTGKVSRYFNYTPTPVYEVVKAMTVSNNKLFIGGNFHNLYDSASKNSLRRDNLAVYDLSTNHLTNDAYNPNNTVNALLPDRQGGVLMAGIFHLTNSVNTQNVAAINLRTGQVIDWKPTVGGSVYAMAIKDTTLFIGGLFSYIGNESSSTNEVRQNLGAISTKTGRPTAWNANIKGNVKCLAVSDSVLYVGGGFTSVKGVARKNAAAIGTGGNGTLKDWMPDPNGKVHSVLPDGNNIYLGGEFLSVKGISRNRLACVNNTNGNANTWNPKPDNTVRALYADNDRLYVGGVFGTIAGQNRTAVAIFDKRTGDLTAFDPKLKNASEKGRPSLSALSLYGSSLFMSSNGDYYTYLDSINGVPRHIIGVVDTATATATPFNPRPDYNVNTIQTTSNKLIVGGNYSMEQFPASVALSVFNLEPLKPASNLLFTNLQPTSVKASWNNGNSEGSIVIVKKGSAADIPEDGMGYNADFAYGIGSKAGSSYIVYRGTGSNVTVTNLQPNHTYYFAVYEYNGSGSGTEYLQTPALTGSITTPCPVYANMVSPAGPVTICQGDSTVLTAKDSMSSYRWSTGATTRSITVKTSGSYTVNIADSNACTGTSQPVVVNYQSCGKPKGLAVKNITATSAILRWRSIPCAISYSVQVKPASSTKWKSVSTVDTILNLTNLTPGTTYNWRVKTVCAAANSSFTNGQNFNTVAGFTAFTANTTLRSKQEENIFQAVVLPNPAKDKAVLSISHVYKPLSVSLTDLTGKVLWKVTNVTSTRIDLPTAKLSAAVYIITVTDGVETKILKLVKA